MPGNKPHILYIGNKLAVHGRTPTGIDSLGPLLEQEGYTLYYAGSRLKQWRRLLDMLLAVWRYRKTADLVLIDTYSTAAFYYAWLCGRLCAVLRLRYIPILHGGDLPRRFKESPQKCRSLFGRSFMNVAVSKYLQEHLQKSGYRSKVISNSICLDDYAFRHRTQLQPKLLWVRSFHETYNPRMAIHLLNDLHQKYPDVHLTMVGPDVDGSMEACRQLSEAQGLENYVTFTGKLSKQEWATLAREHDIFINTTNYDNLPVSVLEAMALGLPVVSTNVGGIPHLVTDKVNGLLVNAGDVAAMAMAVKQLTQDTELAAKLSSNARKYAEAFDWDIIKGQWQALFNTVITK